MFPVHSAVTLWLFDAFRALCNSASSSISVTEPPLVARGDCSGAGVDCATSLGDEPVSGLADDSEEPRRIGQLETVLPVATTWELAWTRTWKSVPTYSCHPVLGRKHL